MRLKPLSLWFMVLWVLCSLLEAQVIIDNPEKPESPPAGRTVLLEEVMRIKDDGESIVFKNPRYLKLMDDGTLVFFDFPNLYRYSKDGEFLFKVFRQGEGPGESQRPDYYFFQNNRIIIHSWIPPKILEYDRAGRYVKERKTPGNLFVFLDCIEGKIYGIRDEIRYSEYIKKEGIFETPYSLYEVSSNFRTLKKIHDIPVKHYIKKAHWFRRTMFFAVPYAHYLFIVSTAEYQVTKLNVRTGRVESIFKRPFKRTKTRQEESDQDPYNPTANQIHPPPFEYTFDIWWMSLFQDKIWVFPSVMKDDCPLIDVFSLDGTYRDYFYLKYPENNRFHRPQGSVISEDGFLYAPEEDKDTGFWSIGKYRIMDPLSNPKRSRPQKRD